MCMTKVFTYHTLLCKRLLSAPGYTEGRSVYGQVAACQMSVSDDDVCRVVYSPSCKLGIEHFRLQPRYVYIDAFRRGCDWLHLVGASV